MVYSLSSYLIIFNKNNKEKLCLNIYGAEALRSNLKEIYYSSQHTVVLEHKGHSLVITI